MHSDGLLTQMRIFAAKSGDKPGVSAGGRRLTADCRDVGKVSTARAARMLAAIAAGALSWTAVEAGRRAALQAP